MKLYLIKGRDRTIYVSSLPYEWHSDIHKWSIRSVKTFYASFIPGILMDETKAEVYEYLDKLLPKIEDPIELEL